MENKTKKIIIKSLNVSLPILAVVLFLPSILQLTKASSTIAANELKDNTTIDTRSKSDQYYDMYGHGNGADLTSVNINTYTNGDINAGKADYGVWDRTWYGSNVAYYPGIDRITSESGDLLQVSYTTYTFARADGDHQMFETPEAGAEYLDSTYSKDDNAYIYKTKTWDGKSYSGKGASSIYVYTNLWLPVAEEEYISEAMTPKTPAHRDVKTWFTPENITLKYGTEYKLRFNDNDGFYSQMHKSFETPTLLDVQLKDPIISPTDTEVKIEIPYTTGVEDKKADGSDWNRRDAYTLPTEYWDIKFGLSGTDFSLANVSATQDPENNEFVVVVSGLEPTSTYDDWKLSGLQYWNGATNVTLPDVEIGPVQLNKSPADTATLEDWSYESTQHDATISYKLNVPDETDTQEGAFASKVEILDSSNKVIASDETDGTTSLKDGTILVDKTASGDPLAADDTNNWTMRVYGDKYDESKYTDTKIEVITKPLDVAKGPKFDTLNTSWTDITKHGATLNYSFDTDFNNDNNTHYMDNENSTIVGATVTTDDESLSITATPSAVTTTNNDFDEHGNGTQTHTGTVKIDGLDPKQTYNNLGLAVDWQSDSWTDAKTSTTPLPALDTANWDAPAAPTVTLSEDETLKNPEGFTVEGTFDATKYDDYNQLPTNIDSINLMYAIKGDEGNPIQTITKTFDEETNIWTGRYAFSGLKAETEYSVWTEVTYSAKGSEDFNGQTMTSDKITVTTGSYDDVLISDFNWTADTTKPSTGQFDIKVTSDHVGDNWYNPVFDPETIVVKDKDGNKLNVSNVTSGKTEGTYTFALKELQGGQTYNGVKISLSNSNEMEVSFTTADLLAPKAPIIQTPKASSITQTSANIQYSFTAASGDSKDYLPTNVEKVELINSATSDTLLTADNTNESGTFKLTGLDIQTEYKVKVKLTYSGGLTVESDEVTFNTDDFKPSQPPVISQLKGNDDAITQTAISAHYKIDVPNGVEYNPTAVKTITAQLDGANDQTIDPTQLEGDVVFDGLEGGTTHKVKIIVEWDDSIVPITDGTNTPIEKEISLTTDPKDGAVEPTIKSLQPQNITQTGAEIKYTITIPQGSETVEPTHLSRVVLLIDGTENQTADNITPTDGTLSGTFNVTGLTAEKTYTATLNVYYLDAADGTEVATPVTKDSKFKTQDKSAAGLPTVSVSNTSASSSWAEFKADVTLPSHDDNVYDIKMISYTVMKGEIELSTDNTLNADDFAMGATTSFNFRIEGLSELKTYNDFSIVINYNDEKGKAQTPITTDIPEFSTVSIDDVVVTKSVISDKQLTLGLDVQENNIDSLEILGINSKDEQVSIGYEVTSKNIDGSNVELNLSLNLDDEYKQLSLNINGNIQELKLVDIEGNIVNSIGEAEQDNNSIIMISSITMIILAAFAASTGVVIYFKKKK